MKIISTYSINGISGTFDGKDSSGDKKLLTYELSNDSDTIRPSISLYSNNYSAYSISYNGEKRTNELYLTRSYYNSSGYGRFFAIWLE